MHQGETEVAIEIRELDEKTMDVYLCCGTQPDEEKLAGEEQKLRWTRRMLDKGLGAKIAFCDGWPAGFINYVPIEVAPAPVEGDDILFAMCIHVNDADDKRSVNHEGKGVGRALVNAVETYARTQGFSGIATLALDADHMPASFWGKMGYELIDRAGVICLMWKPLDDGVPPRLWKGNFQPAFGGESCVHVDVLYCSFCSFHGHIKDIASDYSDRVVLHEHIIDDRETMDIDCICGHIAFFVDGVRKPNWPVGEREWRALIEQALDRKGLSERSK